MLTGSSHLREVSPELSAVFRAKPLVRDDHSHKPVRSYVFDLAFHEVNVKIICGIVGVRESTQIPVLVLLQALLPNIRRVADDRVEPGVIETVGNPFRAWAWTVEHLGELKLPMEKTPLFCCCKRGLRNLLFAAAIRSSAFSSAGAVRAFMKESASRVFRNPITGPSTAAPLPRAFLGASLPTIGWCTRRESVCRARARRKLCGTRRAIHTPAR